MKKLIAPCMVLCLIFINSCQSISYYNHESANQTYTELQLNSNGTFVEYIYFSVQDSLLDDDFGNLIKGLYTEIGDTLLLEYSNVASTEKDVFLRQDKFYIKLKPITYSHHYLNMVFVNGKSTKLRALPNYDSIKWKEGKE